MQWLHSNVSNISCNAQHNWTRAVLKQLNFCLHINICLIFRIFFFSLVYNWCLLQSDFTTWVLIEFCISFFSFLHYELKLKTDAALKQIWTCTYSLIITDVICFSATASWISGFPSRSTLRSQPTGGTAKLTNPCSSASSNTVTTLTSTVAHFVDIQI